MDFIERQSNLRELATGLAPDLSPEEVRRLALEAGFTEAGVVALPHTEESRDAARFETWLDEGRAGSMQYLERKNEAGEAIRSRARIPFPWARSAIVCAASYRSPQAPSSIDPASADAGWIASYAQTSKPASGIKDAEGRRQPSDYHKVLLKWLRLLESKLRERHGEFESRAYVDTGPVVERSLAVAAGLGWQGKNTCLIHPQHGSFTFLAVLLTSLELVQKVKAPPVLPDRCGSCRRCIEACPTNALTEPYQMDARLCISYLTIEHRGPIEPELMEKMGRQVYGCDICQEVCPWNLKVARQASGEAEYDEELSPRPELVNPALDWLASLDEQAWEANFNGSPIRRAGFHGLLRNVAIAMGNSGQHRFTERLRLWADDESDSAAKTGLRSAAEWALQKLKA